MMTASLRSRLHSAVTTVALFGALLGLLLGLSAPAPASAQTRIYVDADATEGATDGSSWDDAFVSLQTALSSAATIHDTLWVAEGTYYPDEVNADAPAESFVLLDSVAVYGGFDGSESSLSERNVSGNRTILSGDIEQDDADPDGDGLIQPGDIAGSNSNHVVEAPSSGGRLDGVYVTAGDAPEAATNPQGGGLYVGNQVGIAPAMTVARTRFVGNRAQSGGAVFVANADVVFSNVEWIGNEATAADGGALYVDGADFGNAWMANVLFSGNSAAGNGGAVAHFGSQALLFNGTMTSNDAGSNGGGVYVSSSTVDTQIRNTTLWNNTAGTSGPQIYTDGPLGIDLSLLEGDVAAIGGTGSVPDATPTVLNADPMFVDSTGSDGTAGTPDDDLRVNWASPGIDPVAQEEPTIPSDSADVDNDGDATEPLPIDLAGADRLQGQSVDVGAYEGGAVPNGTTVVYADAANGADAGTNGGSWSAPYRTLQAALAAARNAKAAARGVPFGEVWVAEGTYYPDDGPGLAAGDSSRSFALVDSVAVYGGFRNGDASSNRNPDPATNGTTLSGDIGAEADTSDNSTNVVSGGARSTAVGFPTLYDLSSAAILDGFTITGGTATENETIGGGLILTSYGERTMNPTLRNLRVTENYARTGAGFALIADSASTVQLRLSEVDFIGNVADRAIGGAVFSSVEATLAPHLANVRFLGNEAGQGGAFGVTVERGGSASPVFSNVLVSGNVSAADSAAAFFLNRNSTLDATLINTTWAGNTASTDSLGRLMELQGAPEEDGQNTSVQVANSILWGNTARSTASGFTDVVRIDSSIVEGGWDGSGSGIRSEDPQYADPSGPDGTVGTPDDSLQVSGTSPALDLGGTSLLPPDATDLDGDEDRTERLPLDLARTDRVQGASVDAGAYEETAVPRPDVTLSGPDELPTPGTSPTVSVTVPASFVPTEGTLYYRPAGASTFSTAAISLPDVDYTEETTVPVDVPGDAVTEKGVQYYVEMSGVRTDSDEEILVTAPSTAPTRTAFVPAQLDQMRAQGTFPSERYRMLTVPADLGDRSVLEALEAQYGSYDPSTWRLARWAPSDSSYRFGPQIDSLSPGRAAWLITADGDSLAIDDARSADASEPRSIVVQPGWNQIGNPFAFPVAWTAVDRPESVRPPVAYDASRPQGERYRFEAEVLQPWHGAFVYNTADTSATLRVPPVEATDETGAPTAERKTLAAAEADSYRLQAIASVHRNDRRLQDRNTWLGFAEGAETTFGPEDQPKPPTVGPHVRLHATADDGPALARSLKPPTSEGAAWTLQVRLRPDERLRSAEEVTVQLAEQGRPPADFQRYVVDLARSKRLPITNGSVTVRLTPDRPSRRLRVIVGTESFAKTKSEGASLSVDETKLRTNAPNPFSEATTVSYQLADRQEVTIAIYDLLGRRVETLVEGPQEPGVHHTTWRATDTNGQSLASGVYFCRMQAGSYTGTQKLVLVR